VDNEPVLATPTSPDRPQRFAQPLQLQPHLEYFSKRLEEWYTDYAQDPYSLSFRSYTKYFEQQAHLVSLEFLDLPTHPYKSTHTLISMLVPEESLLTFPDDLGDAIDSIKANMTAAGLESFSLSSTGEVETTRSVIDVIPSWLAVMFGGIMPCVLIIYYLMLRSGVPFIILGANVLASLASASLVLHLIRQSTVYTVSPIVPSMLICFSLYTACIITLYLLWRFRHELLEGATPLTAARTMAQRAGPLLACTTPPMAVSFLTMLLITDDYFSSATGLGVFASMIASSAACFSLTPALLLTFPSFFLRKDQYMGTSFATPAFVAIFSPSRSRRQLSRGASSAASIGGQVSFEGGSSSPPSVRPLDSALTSPDGEGGVYEEDEDEDEDGADVMSCWRGTTSLSPVLRTLVVVVALVALISLVAQSAALTMSMEPQMTAAATMPTAANDLLMASFGTADANGIYLLLTPRVPSASVFSKDFFGDVNVLLRMLSKLKYGQEPLLHFSELRTITTVQSPLSDDTLLPLPWPLTDLIDKLNPVQFEIIRSLFITPDNRTMVVAINIGSEHYADTFGYAEAFRDGLDTVTNEKGVHFKSLDPNAILAAGNLFVQHDNFEQVSNVTKSVITVMVFGSWFLVAFGFYNYFAGLRWWRSPMAATRVAVFSAFRMGAGVGFLVLVYQEGALDWLGSDAVSSKTSGGLYYTVPMILCSLSATFGLFQEYILLDPLYEFRKRGESHVKALELSLIRSGNLSLVICLITTGFALSMMALQVPLMNQLALGLTFGALLDVLVLRILLMPAVILGYEHLAVPFAKKIISSEALLSSPAGSERESERESYCDSSIRESSVRESGSMPESSRDLADFSARGDPSRRDAAGHDSGCSPSPHNSGRRPYREQDVL